MSLCISTDVVLSSDCYLLNIFKWLSLRDLTRCCYVCKIWRKVTYDSSLWIRLNLSSYHHELGEKGLVKLLWERCRPLLESLDLSHTPVTPCVFNLLSKYCRRLKCLILMNSSFYGFKNKFKFPNSLDLLNLRHSGESKAFMHIAKNLQGVKYFAFTNGFLASIVDYSELFSGMKNVNILDVSHSFTLNDDVVTHVAENCLQLTSLSIRHCSNFYGDSLTVLIENCKELRSLSLIGTSIEDFAFERCSWWESKLEELDISWCRNLTSDGLNLILPKLPRLRYLRLCSCQFGLAIDGSVFEKLHGKYSFLKVLDISYSQAIENEHLIQLIQTLPMLKLLRISNCLQLQKDLLDKIPEGIEVLSTFSEHNRVVHGVRSYLQLLGSGGNSYLVSPLPEVSSTECYKIHSFESAMKKYI